jgi:hypothetical protein
MTNEIIIGKTFALYGCKAWTVDDNSETAISGLFMVEELVYPDRSCGQWEGGYNVFPASYAASGEGPMYFVDDSTFMQQTAPKSYGRMLEMDRLADFQVEDFSWELENA